MEYWADQVAHKIIECRGDKPRYTIAAGITPSGTVHIGNFREVITCDLVRRALVDLGKRVRFIYVWDDFDRFRKVPKNLPKQEILKGYIGKPLVSVPDVYGCHANYAEHFEKEFENSLKDVGIEPEFIYQNKRYRACEYAEEIRTCMRAREKIRAILNKFRKEPLPESWYPLRIYCESCGKDGGRVTEYDGGYLIRYKCTCGHEGELNFKLNGSVKLPWRVDWPMRWHYERVDFEPGGKEHYAAGGSHDTAKLIINAVYGEQEPVGLKYDFIILKGVGGKMSSSTGNVLSLKDCLEIYLPEVIRFLFAGTKPDKEFSIPTDEEIFKVYEDFYKVERIYFGERSERKAHWKRVYEMSAVSLPERAPPQPSFRSCVEAIHIYRDAERAARALGIVQPRHAALLRRAQVWVERYAPEHQRFELNKEPPKIKLKENQARALRELGARLKEIESERELVNLFNELVKKHKLSTAEFFKSVYLVLFNKDHGPRLAPFIFAAGREKIAKLLLAI